MARPLRIEFPGAFYHVMTRGNAKQTIYGDRRDKSKFLSYLKRAKERYGAVVHCYCLMNNHYHLLLETPAGNLSQIMQYLNGAYSTYFNKKYDRVGHLFQGRYKSVLVDADEYCLQVSRYIHMNPVQQGMVKSPWDYEWSSSRFYVGKDSPPSWLYCEFVNAFFNYTSDSARTYKEYLSDCDDSSTHAILSTELSINILGDAGFVESVCDERLHNMSASRDVPDPRKIKNPVSVQVVLDTVSVELNHDKQLTRKMSIYLCHRFSRRPLKEIGDSFGISESAVSLTSNRFAAILHSDQRLAETVASVLSALNL